MTTCTFEVQIYCKDIKTRPENPPLTRRFHPKMSTTNLPTLRWSGFTRQREAAAAAANIPAMTLAEEDAHAQANFLITMLSSFGALFGRGSTSSVPEQPRL